ncbi:MAG: hypothetical protein A3C50_00355 [Candidatus Staskawiczbacteria bacterium RIFCSPHIGHO2_02_FULL_43_16]|uniref:Uncharacterized protein n=1 Tax=Candidatus Staskawiczbacteria bacterium RIFCSPHIGHO2_01_FULL_41_41 TaxID=1802203 RepID=A0A1G2HW78_9BACT|nr:MAG: hypothetical protein A2822_02020 [Candidatus Staskawiczbacteria bacterium RIFCSPHIGHO2_01_FULL_41_41]OGZ68936.1 MAG: hypothetical protein A3C50_00355 [Candidatus Staskawiczbacteria bacterium RIFCSPHIGHO2_02_FULL_43_16]OGZ74882.1 MAG: hypothetical protein A3A12_03460 [Candidatus Staskawiczbacteria bacterium RIFCSPLOWO2_01_FULL_43_17b]
MAIGTASVPQKTGQTDQLVDLFAKAVLFAKKHWIAFAFLAIALLFVGIPVAGTATYFGVKAFADTKATSPEGREKTQQIEQEVMDGYNKNGDNLANSFRVP